MRRFLLSAVSGLAAMVAASPPVFSCSGDTLPATAVAEVYPSAEQLPENLLRFYIYFSAPMRRTHGAADIDVLNADGLPVPGVFLPTRHDLWSPDGRRLTLILDPGRVKTGLAAHDAMGRALVPGERYALRVRSSAVDAAGCRSAAEFTKSFTVTAADATAPDLSVWRVMSPAAGAREPLIIHMNGPHDHLSLAYRLRVRDADGAVVAGSIALADDEQTWRFTPRTPWRSEGYAIVIDPRLEDIAGNRVTNLFDQPVSTDERPVGSAPLELRFTPGPHS